ncbi:MAG: TrkH family potassium uptake protein [Ignavibacteriales bacterium]|jgi:trk system potassium uptake protein TrkH|nr:MAG: TrkH family potassium uptake protein [Ignavibacteriales bacterium]
MRLYFVLRYVGLVLLIDALFLLISALVGLAYGDNSFGVLFYSAVVTALFGFFPLIFVPPADNITQTEGLFIVVASWILTCIVGMLPYVMWGGEFTLSNAWFESVSGFTTTGSSILTDIEKIPLGLLFWRSVTHWLGGMGIIMFVLSVLPSLGSASMILYRTEMSPVAQDNFKQTAKKTLRIVLMVYVGLTFLETIFLMIFGMNLFDAITHSFGTIATGGFSPKNLSVAYYDSLGIEIVIIVFMILSGLHFGLLFSTFFEGSLNIFKSTIVRYYLFIMIAGILVVTINTYGSNYSSFTEALRYSAFQVISLGTSTGFANANSSIWPALSQILLMFFALQCATAGSTSGGIKADRFVMLFKAIGKQLKLLRHPRAIVSLKIGNKNIKDEDSFLGILYIVVYLLIVFVGGLLLVGFNVDPLEAFTGTIAAAGNVGPGLGEVGSTGNFSMIPNVGKWILSAVMILGRLEIYGVILFFLPQTWKLKSE